MKDMMMNEECTCPECGKKGPKSEFMPKQYAGTATDVPNTRSNKKDIGLSVYLIGDKESEEEDT